MPTFPAGDPTALAEQFLESRRQGDRPSIDRLLDSSNLGDDRDATRAEVLRILGRRLRESSAVGPLHGFRSGTAIEAGSSGDSSTKTIPHSAPPDLAGYEIIDCLGRGGMGVVWEAYQTATGRRVAVKFLNDSAASTEVARQRFEREVELLARLQHPHIVSILDSGVHSGRYFYAMDYIEGRPLDVAFAPGQADVGQGLEVMAVIAETVDFAHQRGVLHRDLKPGNILIIEEGGEALRHEGIKAEAHGGSLLRASVPRSLRASPMVLDFGLAKAMDPAQAGAGDYKASLSEPGQLLGTLAYMPPEQSRGRLAEMSVRSDVYALGAVAYELLTGRLPVPVEGALGDVLTRIANEDPSLPSARRPGLSTDIDAILLKALQKSPDRRYATAAEFAADLRRFLTNQPVLARPDTFTYRAGKFVRRNKLAVTFAASVFALVAGFGVWMSVLYARAEERRRETEQVADFQARMLGEIDAEAMGRGVVSHIRKQVQSELERESVGEWPSLRKRTPEEVAEAMRGVEQAIAPAEPVDIARRVIDEYMLRRAGEVAQKEYQAQPLVEARIRSALGRAYDSLGLYDSAETHLRASLAKHRMVLGGEDPLVASDLNDIAMILLKKGEASAAELPIRESLAILRKRAGQSQDQIAKTLGNLGLILKRKGDYAAAEMLYREALAMDRNLLGDQSAEVATDLNNLAGLLYAKGDYSGAESLFREVLAMDRRAHGEESLEAANTLCNLGLVLVDWGKPIEAKPHLQMALSIRQKLLGDEHPDVAQSLDTLADAFQSLRDLPSAERAHRKALSIRRKVLGNQHPAVAQSLNNLASVLLARGEAEQVESAQREALAIYRRTYGNDHPHVAMALANLGYSLHRRGALESAEPLYREALAVQRTLFGDAHPDVTRTSSWLAALLCKRNDYVNAEPLARRSLAARINTDSPRQDDIAESRYLLGRILTKLRKFSEADSILLDALNAIPENAGPQPYDRGDFISLLNTLHAEWSAAEPGTGREKTAAEWREKLAAWQATTQPAATQRQAETAVAPPTRSR